MSRLEDPNATNPDDDETSADSQEPVTTETDYSAPDSDPGDPVPERDDTADRLDKQLAASAYKKTMAGEPLTDKERAALKRFERAKEERLRWQYYRSIPQKHWRQMSGRQAKVLNEQADLYGIPFGGAEISLPAVVKGVHDFLAANARKLASGDDELMGGGNSPALERYREERAALARLDRLEREKVLLPRDEVRDALIRIAGIIRGAGEELQRQFGAAAVDLLYEALDDADREIERCLGDGDDAGSS